MPALLWLGGQALYLFSPLLVSVVLSAIVHRYDLLPAWKVPIDGGFVLGGARLFGESKTWRGVAIAVAGCVLTVTLQRYALSEIAAPIALVDYAQIDPIVFGTTMGVAAMAGELPNSFVKRRIGIAPGEPGVGSLRMLFWVWDQIDLLTITWVALRIWMRPTLALVVMSFALTLALHPLIAWIGYLLGARRSAR